MMPRTPSSWPRQRHSATALESGAGVPFHRWNIFLLITVSLIAFLCIMTVGFFFTCGPLAEPGPGECSPSAAAAAAVKDAKFSSSESTFDLTLYYCRTARHYMNMLHRRWIKNKQSLESIDTCHSATMKEGSVDSQQDDPRHPLQKLRRFLFQRKQHAPLPSTTITTTAAASSSSSSHLTLEDFPNAFSRPDAIVVTESQQALIRTLSQRVRNNIPKFISRANHVAWGGPGGPKWYYPVGDSTSHGSRTTSLLHPKHVLDSMDGGRLLYSYLRILKWPRDLRMHVPVQLCGKPSKGCDVEVALSHTLEFRETFQPFHMTPAAIYENRDGFIYHRGFSPSIPTDDHNNVKSKGGKHHHHHHHKQPKHSLIWFRPGIHKREDSFAYLRAMMYTLDNAIADSLRVSSNKMGKFNVIIDTQGFSFSMVPRLWEVKLGIQILQDHLPDRLGVVFLVNLSHPAEFALNLVRPFLNKEVRNKIRIVPHHDETKKWAILAAVIEPEYIPTWLGGTDDYRFDPDSYYPRHLRISNQQGLEFLQIMPSFHHAAQ